MQQAKQWRKRIILDFIELTNAKAYLHYTLLIALVYFITNNITRKEDFYQAINKTNAPDVRKLNKRASRNNLNH